MASHTGLCIPALPIEAVQAHVSTISTGVLAVFRAFSTPSPAAAGRRRRSGACIDGRAELSCLMLDHAMPAVDF
jgi:hypothetical protein